MILYLAIFIPGFRFIDKFPFYIYSASNAQRKPKIPCEFVGELHIATAEFILLGSEP